MRVLDLFCGAGGAAMGYRRAGFEVVGIDINPQPRYPFEFHRMDAIELLAYMVQCVEAGWPMRHYDVIHASPPCQAYSKMSNVYKDAEEKYPKLIEPVREALQATGLPYVIENVPGAPLKDYVQLCGSQFGLRVFHNGRTYELRRHRGFETNWPLLALVCNHGLPHFPVYGDSRPSHRPDLAGPGFAAAARTVMGIDWMRRRELSESIPPAYTEYVGTQLRQYLEATSNRDEAA